VLGANDGITSSASLDIGVAAAGASGRGILTVGIAGLGAGALSKGKLAFRSGDREEVFVGGDAYYVGPGHTPILYAGTEVVEFSPTEELGRTMEVVTKNMAELETASS
jgi:hypothetical protein